MEIKSLIEKYNEYKDSDMTLKGWIRQSRFGKNVGFIELNDGSCFENVQVVVSKDLENYEQISKQQLSASILVKGKLVVTPNAKQDFEIQASSIEVLGESSDKYPIQKKRQTFEYLRTIPHLRARTNTFKAVFRLRSSIAFAIHKFFHEKNFVYVHTPIVTASDAEGAGEMFEITSLDLNNLPLTDDGKVDYSKDFFGTKSNLTVSGQLEAEAYAMAFSKVYTFGPTFRAEESNTTRHAAEFWMIEPEIAFAQLDDVMDLGEEMLKYVISYVMEDCKSEMEFFNKFVDNTLIERLNKVKNAKFARMTYTQAIDELLKADVEFDYPVKWGIDLQTEHERYISEKIVDGPVFLTDYPKEIKSFYMRLNDDNKTVAACDLLVPAIGELIGGSQREERLDVLEQRMKELNMSLDDYKEYLDLRRFGGCKHGGYGLGFERAVMYLSGMKNIRDVISYPRTVNALSKNK
ncbi:MAG: asparagine--tRNA ligase [Tissierellia bacterium]|nr:asparagine--tRNA ligase [Tissierellia bacterium]